MDAWNAGDQEAWLEAQHPEVEYVSLASGQSVTYTGHEGMREVWDQSRANWEVFRFSVLDEEDGVLEVSFSGLERLQRIEISGVLWFRCSERDGRIVALTSAMDASDLDAGVSGY